MKNIIYEKNDIKEYFSRDRIKWEQFYSSERKVIQRTLLNISGRIKNIKVLDVGCACGGLGIVLKEKFNIKNYTGIEINHQAAQYAKNLNPDFQIIEGDFLEVSKKVTNDYYDFAFSLSCIDWQNNFKLMLYELFNKIKPGGHLLVSLRLTTEKTINDINLSYQYINYDGKKVGEIAPYVIFNINDLMNIFKKLRINDLYAYGYSGTPSETSVTPYKELCFCVFSLKKSHNSADEGKMHVELDLPNNINSKIK